MNDYDPDSLGAYIRSARERAKLSLRQVAAQVGVNYGYLARIESGERSKPSPDVLQKLADALAIDSAELFAFFGVKPALPEPKVYFRRAYGMSESEALEAAKIIENLRAHQREEQTEDNEQTMKGGNE
jgi:transcriptional regulator with XRE-family HTH domain